LGKHVKDLGRSWKASASLSHWQKQRYTHEPIPGHPVLTCLPHTPTWNLHVPGPKRGAQSNLCGLLWYAAEAEGGVGDVNLMLLPLGGRALGHGRCPAPIPLPASNSCLTLDGTV
jgi:hypothetical protein